MKNLGGRPTKYLDSYIAEIDNYLNNLNDDEVPLKEDFAFRMGVDDDTLDNWANAKDKKGHLLRPKFFGALKKIMQKQKIQLINDGIYGGKEVNPTITKLLLQNNHGMKERTDQTTNDKELPTPIYNGKSTTSSDV